MMPTVFREDPYRFFFYALDCDEPVHIHVEREGFKAKFWLDPIKLANQRGFKAHELRDVEKIMSRHWKEIMRKWDDYCP